MQILHNSGCVNPIKTESICPPPSICDMSQITTNGKFVTCTNNAQLFVVSEFEIMAKFPIVIHFPLYKLSITVFL